MLSEGISAGNPLYALSVSIENIKLKYILLVIGLGYYILSFVRSKKTLPHFQDETRTILIMVLVLAFITIIKQVQNGFMSSSYNEVFFLLAPLLYVYFVVNDKNIKVRSLINIAFVIQCVVFLLDIISKLNLQNIRSINFMNSYSPFESEHSFYALVFFIYYLYNNNKFRTILSFIICFLAFKRLAVAVCIVLFIFKILGKDSFLEGGISQKSVIILTIIYSIIPIAYRGVLTTGFQRWFFNLTNIDFSYFVTGRLYRTQLCIETPMLYGLGSTTEFLKNALPGAINRNLHNDILRIYLECGLLGSITLSYCYFKASSKSKISTILMLYLFTDMLFNHFLGAGRTAFWILIYFVIYYFNAEYSHSTNKKVSFNENRYPDISSSI